MTQPYQTLKRKIVLENPWFQLQQNDIKLPNGTQTVYHVLNKANAVWIVPVLSDGRVVLINQYRYPINEWCLEVPAGGIPPDTTPQEAARQELKEEIGGTAQSWTFLGAYWTMNGLGDEKAYLYLATGVELGTMQHEATEIIERRIVSMQTALELAQTGELGDAPSALALLLAQQHLPPLS